MKTRSRILEIVSNFATMVKTQFSHTINVFHMYSTMEYREADLAHLPSLRGSMINLAILP